MRIDLINLISKQIPSAKSQFDNFDIGIYLDQLEIRNFQCILILPMNRGITIIELLVIAALIAIIGTAATPFLSNFILRNNYETTVDKVLSSLNKAQGYSMSGKDGVWGICLASGNKIRLYRGSCVIPDFSEDFDVPPSLTISGLSDTTFSPLRGEPSQALTIIVSTQIGSRTVTLNSAGMIDVN